jgi:hypothetical protein
MLKYIKEAEIRLLRRYFASANRVCSGAASFLLFLTAQCRPCYIVKYARFLKYFFYTIRLEGSVIADSNLSRSCLRGTEGGCVTAKNLCCAGFIQFCQLYTILPQKKSASPQSTVHVLNWPCATLPHYRTFIVDLSCTFCLFASEDFKLFAWLSLRHALFISQESILFNLPKLHPIIQ